MFLDFIKQLEQELKGGIDKILNHPFIERIESGWLDKPQLQYFAKQYSVYCHYFPRFLAAAAAKIPDDATRLPIVGNLWEEHGEGSVQKSHRVLYNKFAEAVGLSETELNAVEPLPTTRICCENMFNLCHQGQFLESLGALGPGTEFFTNREYTKISNGLRKYEFLNDEDIEFWLVHIALDEDHYSDMVKAMENWAHSLENKYLIKSGAKKAVDLEHLFWDGLEDNLPAK